MSTTALKGLLSRILFFCAFQLQAPAATLRVLRYLEIEQTELRAHGAPGTGTL